MKKPTPSQGKSGDSEKLKMKELDVAKEAVKVRGEALKVAGEALKAVGKFSDWGKQAQITKAAVSASHAKIEEAREKTKQAELDAKAKIEETTRLRQKDAQSHTQEMAKLQLQYEQMISLNRDRERVLDKMLEDPENTELLVQSYCALIPPPKS
ncbi:hypothetical protein IPC29_06600 [Pseudomonas aeruginosa]|uniref:hypothetical protein n=1 Tax=Pseudomonas aeruginosa TaxID=287 RepID=UPI000CFF1D1D|nr:hypothetical protein [Pseudomonas aeruginosa]EKX3431165.1 hypothetical protein [Pseudomonas aeruginosa]MBX5576809.1 hypothetical protein [Pseudomonas aeruginosa]MCQ9732359.1 hypothetical protein [Pseudomonas aeruginosa]MCS8237055.1 hypothetical protein [Pseudomonas aeruginosa]MCT0306754.1 hypothetical protein [Pseudomonas aeruginosa]